MSKDTKQSNSWRGKRERKNDVHDVHAGVTHIRKKARNRKSRRRNNRLNNWMVEGKIEFR